MARKRALLWQFVHATCIGRCTPFLRSPSQTRIVCSCKIAPFNVKTSMFVFPFEMFDLLQRITETFF